MVVRLDAVGDRTTAELLRGTHLAVSREEVEAPPPLLQPEPRVRERVSAERAADGVAVVHGGTAEWLALTLDAEHPEAREELLDRLRRLGVQRALARLGVRTGERVRIGEAELTWE